MSGKRQYIKYELNRMKVGQCIRIDRYLFEEAFPWGWPSMYRSPIEAFLSNAIGSAWGCWRVEKDLKFGDYIISRHKEENVRHYVDPDWEYLFKKDKDGYFVSRGTGRWERAI